MIGASAIGLSVRLRFGRETLVAEPRKLVLLAAVTGASVAPMEDDCVSTKCAG